MEKSSMNPEQLQKLLNTVSGKLGTSPAELQSALKSGSIEKAVKNMNPGDKMRLTSMLKDKKSMERLMQSPEAKALYEKLTGNKPR